jgi:hypothetical protein
MSNTEASNIRVQDLDHCGLIAGICDVMGLVEKLDRLSGTHPQEIVTPPASSQSNDFEWIGICQRPTVPGKKTFLLVKPQNYLCRSWHQTRTLK